MAGDFVPLAIGGQWTTIVPLLSILTPYLGLRATLSMTLPCVMALGRTRLLFRASLIYALVHVPLFVAGTALFGLVGAIGSIVVAGILYSYLNVWMLRKALGIDLAEIVAELRRRLWATVAMAGAVLAVAVTLPSGFVPWLSLVAKVAVGGGVFCGVQYALWRGAGRPAGIERRLLQLLGR